MSEDVKKKKRTKFKFKMPSALVIIFAIIIAMGVLSWVIPSGQYQLTSPTDGSDPVPIAGTYEQIPKVSEDEEGNTIDHRQGAWEMLEAPIAGTIEAISVVLFVLILGGFLGITMRTGALDALFGRIIRKLKGREKWIIPILMIFFAIGGTTYGMQEETVAFYALVIPIMLAAGYNGATAAMVIILGAGAGVLGSTINPFSTGIASGFAGVSLGDGIIERLLIFVLVTLTAIIFTMRYAKGVKEGKYKADSRGDRKLLRTGEEVSKSVIPAFTKSRQAIVWIFGLTFLIMIISVIPWAYKFNITFFEDINNFVLGIPVLGALLGNVPPLGDWWFDQLSALFLLSSMLIGWVFYKDRKTRVDDEDNYVGVFVRGAKDLLTVALIIGVARGVSVVMTNGAIMDTIIFAGEQALQSVHSFLLPAFTFLIYLPLSFLIPSTSGLATATMPILAPLADFANIDRSLIVTAFATSSGVINMIAPTVASVMGGLALARVSYGTWLKRTWKYLLIVSIISIAVMTVSALIG